MGMLQGAAGSRAVGVAGRKLMIYGTMIPLVAYYAIFLILPMLYSFGISFFTWNPLDTSRNAFVGLQNYRFALFEDVIFWTCLGNTAYYGLITVPAGAFLAVTVATLINNRGRLSGLFRTIYFLPVVTSLVAAAIVWSWIYQPRFGLLNTLLAELYTATGLNFGFPRYLGDVNLAMPSLIVFSIWHGIGFTTVIFLAGLQSIPQHLYEAGRVDGASDFALFRHVTIPLLRPTFVFVLVTGAIGALQMFTQSYVLTKGGPVDATRTIVYLLYDQAFSNFQFGYASSVAFILFAIILTMTVMQLKFLQTGWEY